KINLDDDIRSHLEGDYANLEYNGQSIKIINLANHSSGLPEDIIPKEFDTIQNPTMFDIVDLYRGDRGEMFLRDLHTVQPDTLPGHKIQYSNVGMIILGIILENVYGLSYAQLVQRYISEPLSMHNTQTVAYVSETDNYTKGYDRQGNVMPHITFQIAGAAGGLKSTPGDMVLFLQGNAVEQDEAIKLSHQSTILADGYNLGLGWQIGKTSTGKKQLWHDGGEPGFSAYIAVIPGDELGIILLANQRGRQNHIENLGNEIIKEMSQQ
ncbi:serine hydrolase domain-containing protein, partial [Candidatus Neomarinimicrobiota bacterium]